MTDEQINIAIAEAYGRGVFATTRPTDLPDYCNDLNAMHEAEGMLTEDQRKNYWVELYEFAPRRVFSTHKDNWQMIHPTARQRAEAFLRTIGKWEEVQP